MPANDNDRSAPSDQAKYRGDAPSNSGANTADMSKRERRKNVTDKETRRGYLEANRWTMDVTAKSVKCGACGTTIRLDQRSEFFPFNWTKHEGRCKMIKKVS
ncbi:hypothetical protein BD779DRAFT_624754 [Infundibulicybe gibba]|nr:hypothetical protein BD779DRAFT_624754 [Infundibulicybe gibba]